MSGVVEVALPRYSITPLDRDEDPEYWKLSRRPSGLMGGTWTKFNWNCLITGSRLYRLQYSDELQVPKAEIDLEELISFLMDRGAVPDVKGLHMLRSAGLWTPTETSLMLSPDTTQKVLRVALPDDSDGVLSLTLQWKAAWDDDGSVRLRPGWMSINLSKMPVSKDEKKALNEKEKAVKEEKPLELEKSSTQEFAEDGVPAEMTYENPNIKPTQPPSFSTPSSLRLRFSHSGSSLKISNAVWKHDGGPLAETMSLEHLQKPPVSNWLPSIALAIGLSRSLPLYNHSLDPSLKALGTRDTIPCGVLVTLDIIPESDAPSWETKHDPFEHTHQHHSQFMAKQRAINAENMMPVAQAHIARQARQAAELQQMSDQSFERMRRDQQRNVARKREAVASPRLETGAVTNAALKWLIREKRVKAGSSLQDAIELVVVGIIKEEEQALSVCTVLQSWRNWSDRGGMTIEELDMLASKKQAFCNAACVMGLLKEVCTKEESTVAADMRECVQHWKKVRLG